MPITRDHILAFHDFALQKLNNGGAESITELATMWDAARVEFDAAVGDVQQGLLDDAAGLGKPLATIPFN